MTSPGCVCLCERDQLKLPNGFSQFSPIDSVITQEGLGVYSCGFMWIDWNITITEK